MRVRVATTEDVVALAALGARTFRETFETANDPADMAAYLEQSFTPERILAELEDPASTFLLAFVDSADQPSGYAQLRVGAPNPAVTGQAPIQLSRLYVGRDALGRGVGAALMQASLDEAERARCETVWLGVWERNERAIAFYRRWGFEAVGSHEFVLGSDRQTDWIMQCAIPLGSARRANKQRRRSFTDGGGGS